MRDAGVLSQPQLEILRQLFSAATAEASAAMSRWTGGLITLSLDEVEETPLSAVAEAFHFADQLANMVVLGLKGELGGTMILVFDEQNGRALANRLLGRAAPETGEWSDLEQSALCETGNILVCAYMNALTRLLEAELVPTPPLFIQDFGASVLDQALMAQAACSDEILLCRTGFHSPAGDLGWHVLFVPTPEMRQELERTLSCPA